MIYAGIDLGANSIRLFTLEEGLLFDEPCMVAVDQKSHVLAIGKEAYEMKGMQDEQVRVISPIQDNQVDIQVLELLLEQLCFQYKIFRVFTKTTILFSYPTSLSNEACEEIKNTLIQLGAHQVFYDREIWFTALGSQLNLSLPKACCIMNVGSSNCDIALFSNSQMVRYQIGEITGQVIGVAISSWLYQQKKLLVTENTLEEIIRTGGSILQEKEALLIPVVGIDSQTKTPKNIQISENEIAILLEPLALSLANWITDFLRSLSIQEQKDVVNRGIVCAGGIMRLKGMVAYLQDKIGCPIYLMDDPIYATLHGMEIVLQQLSM